MGTRDNSTPEGMAQELNDSYDAAKERAEGRASNKPAKVSTDNKPIDQGSSHGDHERPSRWGKK